MSSMLHPLQRRFGEVLRSRVAGDDAEARGQQIWGTPGKRWFTITDPIWRIHGDASMFAGGVTALLLQSLHPLAMAGVAGHSGYISDPWGRLQRTSHYIAVTTYATIEDASAVIGHVRAVHDRVRGKDHRGRPYRASDPHLLAWVHAAEIDSFLRAYRAYGGAPLSEEDADLYVRQAAVPARLLGVVEPPESVAALAEVLALYRRELEASPAAVEAAAFLLREPPLSWVAKPGYWMLAAGGVALLPDWACTELGIETPPDVALRGLGSFGTAAVRWGLAGVENRRSSPPPE
jgi:uncharacterized protein (DUF2236 family)